MESTASMTSAATTRPQNAVCALDTAHSTGPSSALPDDCIAWTTAWESTSWKFVSQNTTSAPATRSHANVTASTRFV